MRLEDKVAIVTGSGAGIGKGIAEVFAKEGAKVVIATRSESNGIPTADQIVESGGEAKFIKCDVSIEDNVKNLVIETVEKYGKIDVLVNNAGVYIEKDFVNTTPTDWDRIINIDLKGTYFCTWYCVPEMLKIGRGSVVNITSNHTMASLPGASPYAAAKWGVVGFGKALAVELAEKGIRVNALSPGLIDTPLSRALRKTADSEEGFLSFWKANIPTRRLGTSEEIAYAAVFLASDESSYVTGINLVADGGTSSQLTSEASFQSDVFEGKE